MRRYNAILLGLLIIGIGYYFYSKEEKYSDTEVYFVEGKAHSLSTDKKISGEILSKNDIGVYYRKYKKGIIKSEKIVDENLELIEKISFNNLGLLEGELYDNSQYNVNGTKQILNYKNNILQGKNEVGNNIIYFIDGTINGINPFAEYPEFDGTINYKKGIPDFIELDIPSSEYPKKLLLNVPIPEKFSGGIFQTLKKDSQDIMKLSEYQEGLLTRERIYSNEISKLNEVISLETLVGIKYEDIFYYKNGKINKKFTYNKNGILENLISFNSNGEKEGLFIENEIDKKVETIILNYNDNILNGKYEKYSIAEDNKIKKLFGFYKLGIFSGQRADYGKIENYVNGFKTENIDLDKIIEKEKIVIEELEEIPEKFTGFNRDGFSVINEYVEGKLFKQYYFKGDTKTRTETKEMKDNGGYTYDTYDYGLISTQKEFDEFNIQNGKYIEYYYQGESSCTKTISNIVNGKLLGESIHYHDDERVSYIDIYDSNGTYTRTYYTNYENNEIEKIVTGRKINGVWTEDIIQEITKEYIGKYTYGHEVEVFTDEKTGVDYWIYGNIDSLNTYMAKLMTEKKIPYVEVRVKIRGIDKGKADNGLAAENDKQMKVEKYSIIE
ncbi:MAG: hypothetical protein ACRCVS_03235 [Fusobacteriaceae bacterium]